jgi:hypothetical protein
VYKTFQHRDKWFAIYPAICSTWKGCGYAVHVPNELNDVSIHYYYVQKDDSLWSISREDLEKSKAMYNGRWHIDRNFLTRMEITPEWREAINDYKRK